MHKHSHYFKDVADLTEIDVYMVCELFGINDPSGATQHAIKKLLLPGQRGAKDHLKDLKEARDSINRRIEIVERLQRENVDKNQAELIQEICDSVAHIAPPPAPPPIVGRADARLPGQDWPMQPDGLPSATKRAYVSPYPAGFAGQNGPQVAGTSSKGEVHPDAAALLAMSDSEFIAMTGQTDLYQPRLSTAVASMGPVGIVGLTEGCVESWKSLESFDALAYHPECKVMIMNEKDGAIGCIDAIRVVPWKGGKWRLATQEEGGWVCNAHGMGPVSPNGRYDLLLRNGGITLGNTDPVWKHEGMDSDCIGWRVSKNQKA